MDVDTGESGNLERTESNITFALNTITFTTERLRTNRRYNITVTARNIAGSSTDYFQASKGSCTLYMHTVLPA